MEENRTASGCSRRDWHDRWSLAAAVGLFLLLASLIVFDRGQFDVELRRLLLDGGPAGHAAFLPFCPTLPACLRVGGSVVSLVIEQLIEFLSLLFFNGEAVRALFAEANNGQPSVQWYLLDPVRQKGFLVPIAATVIYRTLCLTAALAIALHAFRTPLERTAYLLLTFGALLGWPLAAVEGFFTVMSHIADWPRHYFIYFYFAEVYDFGSLGFVLLLVLVLARPRLPGPLGTAALSATGQTIFENLGLVAGVAVFVATLLRRDASGRNPLWPALSRLGAAGLASVAVGVLLIWGVTSAAPDGGGRGMLADVVGYVAGFWHNYGVNNLRWWKVLVADSVSIMAFPLFLGALLGAAIWIREGRPLSMGLPQYRQFAAAAGVAAGFALSLLPGFFVSGMTSDLGRQMAPLACVAVLLGVRGAALGLSATVSRLAARRPQGA